MEGLLEHVAGLRPDRLGEAADRSRRLCSCPQRGSEGQAASPSSWQRERKRPPLPLCPLHLGGLSLRAPASEVPPKETLSWQCPRLVRGKGVRVTLLLPVFAPARCAPHVMHERDPLHSPGLSSSPALHTASSPKPLDAPSLPAVCRAEQDRDPGDSVLSDARRGGDQSGLHPPPEPLAPACLHCWSHLSCWRTFRCEKNEVPGVRWSWLCVCWRP